LWEIDDIDLMARLIYGEARGEGEICQYGVCQVIKNRVEHPDFPNSISGVKLGLVFLINF